MQHVDTSVAVRFPHLKALRATCRYISCGQISTPKPYKYYNFKRVWKSDRAVPATQNGPVDRASVMLEQSKKGKL